MALLHPGPRSDRRTEQGRPAPAPAPSPVRVLAVAAIGPLLLGYTAVAALLAVATATAARAQFSTAGVLAAAVPGWLAAHQVPVTVQGGELGALPLLPTIGAALLVWRTAARAVTRLGVGTPRVAVRVVGTIAGAHAALGLALALLCAGGPVTVDPLAGLYYPALLSGTAAAVGVFPRSGLLRTIRERVDPFALRGLKAGLLGVGVLFAVGTAVVVAALLASFGTARDLFAADGVGSATGMLLLSAGYLPNAAVAATGFIAGPGFALGQVGVGVAGATGGAVPALPLLAALPEQHAAWWPALCALPAAVGCLVGWALRTAAPTPTGRLRAVAVAAVVVAMAFAVFAGSAGGALGSGPFHPLDLRAAWLSLALVLWIGVPGAVVAWTTGPRPVPARDEEPRPTDSGEPGEAGGETEEDSGAETDDRATDNETDSTDPDSTASETEADDVAPDTGAGGAEDSADRPADRDSGR
ncbi:putative membrane protein related to de Novo purine biosynthesis [Actinokineospora spheciospongiae]|uniref:Putative membrane protein related to de Novo purine biosynthesis n=1 Tax=Actinokineospora spheciospongiae TaxID=909613 RepID=W7J011_9PSEU|nr:DUF6350 family protein [Actinokineospora spheciospongiae]EWC62287.1 putative membrane protein related to de Novo purine biosynthesis [Actinokineospora spheciospongiae]